MLCMDSGAYNNMLPKGAKGFDLGEFAMDVRPDGKLLMLLRDGSNQHWTVHPGAKSGVLDLHKTTEAKGQGQPHETVFAIKHDDLADALFTSVPIWLPEILKMPRPLRLGWMWHRGITFVRGILPTREEFLKACTLNSRKRLVVDLKRLQENLRLLENPYVALALPDEVFGVVRRRRRHQRFIGYARKVKHSSGDVSFYWIKSKDIVRFTSLVEGAVKQAIRERGIPPDVHAANIAQMRTKKCS